MIVVGQSGLTRDRIIDHWLSFLGVGTSVAIGTSAVGWESMYVQATILIVHRLFSPCNGLLGALAGPLSIVAGGRGRMPYDAGSD